MKKLILIVAFLAAVSVQAREHWRSGFTVGLEGNFILKDDIYGWQNFKGSTITGGYKWYVVKGLFVKPALSVYYESHEPFVIDNLPPPGYPLPKVLDWHAMEMGLGLSALVGYTVPAGRLVSLEFFTGPYYSYGIDQHETYKRETTVVCGNELCRGIRTTHWIGDFNRSSFRWKFGVGVNVWKFAVNVSYDVSALKPDDRRDDRESNVLSVGLGYNF